jgi:hypothetical protein
VAALAEPLRLNDRFVAAPGRTISVYVASAPVALADALLTTRTSSPPGSPRR